MTTIPKDDPRRAAVRLELSDRRLLNDVDDDLHDEIIDALIAAAALSPPAPEQGGEPVAYVFPEDIRALRSVPEHRATLHVFADEDPRGIPMVALYTAPPSSAAIRDAALAEAHQVAVNYSKSAPDDVLLYASEEIAADIAALRAQPADDGWRDMADCPSDGRPVWIACWLTGIPSGGEWELEEREADGEWWRQNRKSVKFWRPNEVPPPPQAKGG